MLLDSMAQKYGKLPSEIVGLNNQMDAFDFNAAVMIIAEQNRNEIRENKDKSQDDGTELDRLQRQYERIRRMQQADSPYGS